MTLQRTDDAGETKKYTLGMLGRKEKRDVRRRRKGEREERREKRKRKEAREEGARLAVLANRPKGKECSGETVGAHDKPDRCG